MEKKEYEHAEKCFHRAQTMIGEKFSEDHPLMMNFNASLIEVYS